jgi:hypothetical protein
MKGFVHIIAIIVIAVIIVILLLIALHLGPWARTATSPNGEKAFTSELI